MKGASSDRAGSGCLHIFVYTCALACGVGPPETKRARGGTSTSARTHELDSQRRRARSAQTKTPAPSSASASALESSALTWLHATRRRERKSGCDTEGRYTWARPPGGGIRRELWRDSSYIYSGSSLFVLVLVFGHIVIVKTYSSACVGGESQLRWARTAHCALTLDRDTSLTAAPRSSPQQGLLLSLYYSHATSPSSSALSLIVRSSAGISSQPHLSLSAAQHARQL